MEEISLSLNVKRRIEGETHSNIPPWLDLVEPLVELILERLPIVDYIRFASVCKKWHSIQKSHRLHYWPLPPPMPHPLPWLFPHYIPPNQDPKCYSLLEQKSYCLTLPNNTNGCTQTLASCFGWLFLLKDISDLCLPMCIQLMLYNPITRHHISLPSLLPVSIINNYGLMSAPPTDPECTILLVTTQNIFLYRLIDCGQWMMMKAPEGINVVSSAVYCGGSFYFKYYGSDLYVIDANLPTPTLHKLKMEFLERELDVSWGVVDSLLEIEGEVILVRLMYEMSMTKPSFQVFKADLCEKKWVRMVTLGDRALFVNSRQSLFLLAADVGCQNNCIYFANALGSGIVSWQVFDLGTNCWTDGAPFSCAKSKDQFSYLDFWFLPTLSSVNQTRANGNLLFA